MTLKSFFSNTITCIFLVAITSNTLNAQYNKLLDDSNISWLAEFTTDHNFSLSAASSNKESVMLTKLYKDPAVNDYNNLDHWIIDWVFQNAIDGEVECFSDPGLTQAISSQEINDMISFIDTVTTFNADTYEEQIVIVKGSINPEEVVMLRMNQVIFYNKKSKNFETKLIAVAPLINKGSKTEPMFWIKMNEKISNSFNIHNKDITWGALAFSKASPLDLNFINVLKNTNIFDLRSHLYNQAINGEKKIESIQGYGSNFFLNAKAVKEMYVSVDTVITFNPDTYEETIQIISNKMSQKEISQFRLVQEWYYDSKKKKLMNRLKAIAPIVRMKNDSNQFLYQRPLYYIRYE